MLDVCTVHLRTNGTYGTFTQKKRKKKLYFVLFYFVAIALVATVGSNSENNTLLFVVALVGLKPNHLAARTIQDSKEFAALRPATFAFLMES